MQQLIEVPGMGTVEFPDSMADQDISAAIQREMRTMKGESSAELNRLANSSFAPAARPMNPIGRPPALAEIPRERGGMPSGQIVHGMEKLGFSVREPAPPPRPIKEPGFWEETGQRVSNVMEAASDVMQGVPGSNPAANMNAWEVANKGVVPFSKLAPKRGVWHEVADFAEGMTSPLNAGIIVGTGGLGHIGGAAAKVLPRLVSAGFSLQMLGNAAMESPDLVRALRNGDYLTARELATRMGLNTAMGTAAGTHALKGQGMFRRLTGRNELKEIIPKLEAAEKKAVGAAEKQPLDSLLESKGVTVEKEATPTPRAEDTIAGEAARIQVQQLVERARQAEGDPNIPVVSPQRQEEQNAPPAPQAPVREEFAPPKAQVPPENATAVAPPTRVPEAPSPPIPNPATVAAASGERGAFSLLPQRRTPLTPDEVYVNQKLADREAARKGPGSEFIDKVMAVWRDAKTKLVDSTAPITDALAKAQKQNAFAVRPSENIDYRIDRAQRAASIGSQFMEQHGLPGIIRDVENLGYLDQYLIARHAGDVSARGFETGRNAVEDSLLVNAGRNKIAMQASGDFILTVPGPTGTRTLSAKTQPQVELLARKAGFGPGWKITRERPAMTYGQVAQQVNQYSRDVLDYSAETGLISKDLAANLKTIYPEYVPLNRVFSELEKGTELHGGGRGPASVSTQSVVQKLEGSKREIENPLASIIDKTYNAFKQGEKNQAAKVLAGYRDLPGMSALIREVKPGHPTPKHSFSYLDEGRKRVFETTPEIEAAAKSLDVQQLGLAGRIAAFPVRVAKLGITGINLPFVFSNIVADFGHTLVTARSLRPGFDLAVVGGAAKSAVAHDAAYQKMIESGAGFTSFDMLRSQGEKSVENIRAGHSVGTRSKHIVLHPISSFGDLIRATENIVGRSEEFGRQRLFEGTRKALLKEGRTASDAEVLATLESNNALPNYYRAGEWGRALNGVFLYLNAGIQGSRSFLRSVERNPKSTFAKLGIGLYLPVAITTAWNLSDPERAKIYGDIDDYEKNANLIIIPPGSTKDERGRYKVFKLKLPQGLNSSTVPVRRAIEQWYGGDTVKFEEVASALIGTVSPIEPNMKSISSYAVPQVMKPSAQAIANYDFFRQKPKIPATLQGQPVERQAFPYTSGTARIVGRAMGKVPFRGGRQVSPIIAEEFLRDTFGGVASQVMHYTDKALAAVGAIPKDQIGGTPLLEAVGARFLSAHGGAREQKQWDLIDKAKNVPSVGDDRRMAMKSIEVAMRKSDIPGALEIARAAYGKGIVSIQDINDAEKSSERPDIESAFRPLDAEKATEFMAQADPDTRKKLIKVYIQKLKLSYKQPPAVQRGVADKIKALKIGPELFKLWEESENQ